MTETPKGNKLTNPARYGRANNGRVKGSKNKHTKKTEIEQMFEAHNMDMMEEIVKVYVAGFKRGDITYKELQALLPYASAKKPETVDINNMIDLPPITLNAMTFDDKGKVVGKLPQRPLDEDPEGEDSDTSDQS